MWQTIYSGHIVDILLCGLLYYDGIDEIISRQRPATLMRKRYKCYAGIEFGSRTYPGLPVYGHKARIAKNFVGQRRLFLRRYV